MIKQDNPNNILVDTADHLKSLLTTKASCGGEDGLIFNAD